MMMFFRIDGFSYDHKIFYTLRSSGSFQSRSSVNVYQCKIVYEYLGKTKLEALNNY